MIIKDVIPFLEFFPTVTPPIILSAEEIIIYSRENKPFSQHIINDVMNELHKEEVDEDYSEFIPCFKLEKENAFIPLVYYKAGLLKSEYHLLILSEKGKVLDTKALAGTFLNDNETVSYVASIDEDHHIQIVIGSHEGNRNQYNPLNSKTIAYDIAPDGKIILSNHPVNEE